MAARKNRGVNELPDDWKNKIRASAIMNRLNDCVSGEIEMTPQQIKAADIILKKIIPDLARSEIKHEGEINIGKMLAAIDEPDGQGT